MCLCQCSNELVRTKDTPKAQGLSVSLLKSCQKQWIYPLSTFRTRANHVQVVTYPMISPFIPIKSLGWWLNPNLNNMPRSFSPCYPHPMSSRGTTGGCALWRWHLHQCRNPGFQARAWRENAKKNDDHLVKRNLMIIQPKLKTHVCWCSWVYSNSVQMFVDVCVFRLKLWYLYLKYWTGIRQSHIWEWLLWAIDGYHWDGWPDP